MNIAGLNNLLANQGPKAKGSATSKDSKGSSFEDVLGQTKSERGEDSKPVEKQAKREVSERPSREFNGKPVERRETRSEQRSPEPKAGQKQTQSQTQSREDSPRTENQNTQEPTAEQSGLESGLPGQGMPTMVGGPSLQDRMLQPVGAPMGQAVNKAAMLGKQDESVDSLTRRVVWNDFLRKMKEDLGVSAEDVLGAFGSLSDEDLAMPPAQSVDKIVMALGLNDQQATMAKQYFQELIAKTQTRSLGEELQTSSNQISLTLMSERELQRKAMERNLASMNQNFFMNGMKPQMAAMPAAMQTPTSAQPNSVRIDGERDREASAADGIPGLAALTPDLGLESAAAPKAAAPALATAAQTPANAKAMNEMTAQMQPVNSEDKSLDQLVQKFMSSQGQSASATAAKAKQMQAAMAAASAAPSASAAPAAGIAAAPALSASTMNNLLAALNSDASGGGEEEQGQSLDASYLNAPFMDANSKLNGPMQNGNDFQSQLAHVKPGAPMEVPDLVQQAQIMVREGGGEMKVTMSPDGLGEVAMRVSVDQGKVNVQMITESDEAKKMIERTLGDLKSSLHNNHLQVADIKVDTATNMGKQMEQQYQDAQRQMTQSSWEQFRQDNQGWRRNQFEVPSARTYKGQSNAMRDVEAPSGGVDARRAGNSRRLNLVA